MELKTQEAAKMVAARYKETGDIRELIRDVSNLGWYFGKYSGYNRKLLLGFLLDEFKEVE